MVKINIKLPKYKPEGPAQSPLGAAIDAEGSVLQNANQRGLPIVHTESLVRTIHKERTQAGQEEAARRNANSAKSGAVSGENKEG